MKKIIFTVFVVFNYIGFSEAQISFPYKEFTDNDLLFSVSSTMLLISERVKFNPLTLDQINSLSRNDVPFFDRFAIDRYSVNSAKISDYLLVSSVSSGIVFPGIMPFFLPEKNKRFSHILKLTTMAISANYYCMSVTDFVKVMTTRPRPFVYRSDSTFNKFDIDARMSFFSGHTSVSAVNFFLIARFYHDIFPESKWKNLVLLGSAIIPAYMGYLRVNSGKHFLSDVITGYAVGAAIGWFYPTLYKPKKSKNKITFYPFQSGRFYGMSASLNF